MKWSEVTAVVKTLWPLTGAVCVDGRRLTQVTERGDGGDGAHTRDGGHGGGDALATTDAAVCVDGRRLTEVSHGGDAGGRTDGCAGRDSGGGDALATAVAAVCVGGRRLTDLTDK